MAIVVTRDFLVRMATDLRRELEKRRGQELLNHNLQEFPTGCCGYVTIALGDFLQYRGIESTYICGTKGELTHAWLQVDGWVVDITADQFEQEQRPDIYVGPLDGWYASWTQESSAIRADKSKEEKMLIEILSAIQ